MPIYEYRCKQCGEVSEIMTGVGFQSDIFQCKGCGSTNMEKILSVSTFTFRDSSRASGTTCCGKTERCDTPPCSTGSPCRRD